MALPDFIKRWMLERKGFSYGRKRRVHEQSSTLSTLEHSALVRLALYATLAVASALLVLKGPEHSFFAAEPYRGMLYGFALALTVIAMFDVGNRQVSRRNSRVVLVLGGILLHVLVVRLVMALADLNAFPEVFRFLFVPMAFAPILHGVLLGRTVGGFSAICVSLLGALVVPKNEMITYLIVSLVAGITAILSTERIGKRLQILQAGLYVGIVMVGLALGLGKLEMIQSIVVDPWGQLRLLGLGAAAALGTALLTAMIVSGLLPVLESLFNLTTDITWLELSDLNHRLLKRMQLEAPGTFHHSLIVAALAEAAAERIGANAPMCRVCAYFHDIGKLTKPAYFIENQSEGMENPHDALTPTMSALVIMAHVKDGVDLALKHKLNPRILQVIQEHHGDSLVYYFYRKAQEQKRIELAKAQAGLENHDDLPQVDEKSFRYPGPRPRTRESGIIALADTIESASRCLHKPTAAKIRGLVEELVRARLNEGLLDECPLNLSEISRIKESFTKTLASMMHTRIDYVPRSDDKAPSSGPTNSGNQAGRREAQSALKRQMAASIDPAARKHELGPANKALGNLQSRPHGA